MATQSAAALAVPGAELRGSPHFGMKEFNPLKAYVGAPVAPTRLSGVNTQPISPGPFPGPSLRPPQPESRTASQHQS